MNRKIIFLIVCIALIFTSYFLFNKEGNKFSLDLDDNYYSEKYVIKTYFENLLSDKYHQLDLGATSILFDEKIIEDIELQKISELPIVGRANGSQLKEKYPGLEEAIVFEIDYSIKYRKDLKHLATRDDGKYKQYITLIKLKNISDWMIEEIGY